MPSLAASSEAEAERAAKRVVVLRLDVERQRLMQKGLDEAAGEGHDDVWPQGWRRQLPAKLADDPVVRVLRRASDAESTWIVSDRYKIVCRWTIHQELMYRYIAL